MPMNPITEKDIKALRMNSSKRWRIFRLIVFFFLTALMVVAGVINLHYCSRFSDLAGVSMRSVIQDWFAGVDTSAQYSGLYLKAIDRWTTAILQFSAAGIFVLMYAVSRGAANRDARILKFIEEKGN